MSGWLVFALVCLASVHVGLLLAIAYSRGYHQGWIDRDDGRIRPRGKARWLT